jgi:4,5:9,10-diseco-3-hydroxy-5,9,17-trioxoandrosta-1(10),2-diene-4-oate hydrolase
MTAASYRTAVGAFEPRATVTLDGVEIAYSDSGGSGPILLCLHAIGHGAGDFRDLSRRLRGSHRVMALDFPGHGRSAAEDRPACGLRYTELLGRFVDALRPGTSAFDSVTLLGNSIGGAVAIRYALRHPTRVNALVLCDSGGLRRVGLPERLFTAAFAQFFATGRRRAAWFPWAFAHYYQRVLRNAPAWEQRDRIVRSAFEIAPALEQAWRSFGSVEESLWWSLPQIRCPVLAAWANRDIILPLTRHAPALQCIPTLRLETFDGGHAAFLEDPDRFEQALRRFLADVPVTRAAPAMRAAR